MRYFETFNTEEQLKERIRYLRDNQYENFELEVFTSNELHENGDYYYRVNRHDGEASLGDKIAAFFTGEDPEDRVFNRYEWTDDVKREARRAVDKGQYVLVVKREGYYDNPEHFTYRDSDPFYTGINDGVGFRGMEFADEDLAYDRKFAAQKGLDFDRLDDEQKIQIHEEGLRVRREKSDAVDDSTTFDGDNRII